MRQIETEIETETERETGSLGGGRDYSSFGNLLRDIAFTYPLTVFSHQNEIFMKAETVFGFPSDVAPDNKNVV